MSTNIEARRSWRAIEVIKWLIVIILLIVAIVGNYCYRDFSVLVRTSVIVFMIVIATGVALMTTTGKFIIAFSREARIEVRKVIWPTRQETVHTTLIVAAVTSLMSLILWGLDSILVRVLSFITSLRF